MATTKQKLAAQKLSEIIRNSRGKKNISLAKILKDAGYSDSVARKPQLVTDRKGWKELTRDLLPDEVLLDRLNNLVTMPLDVSHIRQGEEVVVKEELNSANVARGLDMSFKLKGYYHQAKQDPTYGNLDKYDKLSLEDLTKLSIGMYKLDDKDNVVLISGSDPDFWTSLSSYKQTLKVVEQMKAEVEASGILPENHEQF